MQPHEEAPWLEVTHAVTPGRPCHGRGTTSTSASHLTLSFPLSSTDIFSQRRSSLLIYAKYLRFSRQKLINRHTVCKLMAGKWPFVVAWEGFSSFSRDTKTVWRKGLCKASFKREVPGWKGEVTIAPSPEEPRDKSASMWGNTAQNTACSSRHSVLSPGELVVK